MKKHILFALALLAACGTPRPQTMVDQMRSDDAERVRGAMDALTARGKDALPELRAVLKDNDLRLRRRAKEVIARITGQWGDGSGLAWRRSFDAAVEEAGRTQKPVLLLNLFGKLDEEIC